MSWSRRPRLPAVPVRRSGRRPSPATTAASTAGRSSPAGRTPGRSRPRPAAACDRADVRAASGRRSRSRSAGVPTRRVQSAAGTRAFRPGGPRAPSRVSVPGADRGPRGSPASARAGARAAPPRRRGESVRARPGLPAARRPGALSRQVAAPPPRATARRSPSGAPAAGGFPGLRPVPRRRAVSPRRRRAPVRPRRHGRTGEGSVSNGPSLYSSSALIASEGSKTLGSTSSKVTESTVWVNSIPMLGMLIRVEVGTRMPPNSL